jgi:hypothetical protein
MDEELYKEIYNKVLNNGNTQTESKYRKYKIEEGILYRKDQKNNEKLLKIIRRHELEVIMFIMHDHPISAHFAIEATFNKIRERYYWPKMYEDIKIYVESCDQCQRRGKPQKRNELHPIEVIEPFYQVGIDIVGPLPKTDRNNRYIVVAMDYFTKWPEAKAITEANAKEVATFIYEEIICRHGCPTKILSDRGSHFNNQLIGNLVKRFQIKHKFSTPYHPKTNGLVERFNKTLCEALAKLTEKGANWDLHIGAVLFAYRNKKHNSTKIKPFYLMYGREAKIPLDTEIHTTTRIGKTTIEERLEYLLEELPKIRQKAKLQNDKTQEKQKEYHDKQIKRKQDNFKIGEKVLYYNAAKEKQWSGKLEEKWKGPYYIQQKLLNGSYKIKEINGRVLKTPVNGELLKRYNSREEFVPYVVV